MSFLKDLAERALSTAAQAALAVVALDTFNLVSPMDLRHLGLVAATAALLSVLKSLAARQVGDPDDASLVK